MSGFDPFAAQEEEFGGFDDDDIPETGAKETTGRWTREEHHVFIKGLEMYGKAWKKIAMAIKTRTVVQIRTHAQKYFLKLSKARQNGDNSFAKGIGQGKRRKSRSDRPIVISLPLQPFLMNKPITTAATLSSSNGAAAGGLGGGGGGGGGGALHTSSMSSMATADLGHLHLATDDVGALENNQLHSNRHNKLGEHGDDVSAKPVITNADAEKCLYNFLSSELHRTARHPPDWYSRGLSIAALLGEAEKLDWASDAGVAVPLTQVTNTSAAYKPTGAAEERAAQMLVEDHSAFDSLASIGGLHGMTASGGGMLHVRQDAWGSIGGQMHGGLDVGMDYMADDYNVGGEGWGI